MKSITFIRHGEAENGGREPDRERTLTKKGKNDAVIMGRVISASLNPPDLFLCSPAKRAQKTAKRITKELGLPKEFITEDSRLYTADLEVFNDIASGLEDSIAHVYLCGHNPALLDLVNHFSETGINTLPPGGVVNLVFEIDKWEELSKGSGILQLYDFPERHYDPEILGATV